MQFTCHQCWLNFSNSYRWLASRTRFWTAVMVDASFCPVTRCLSTTTWTAPLSPLALNDPPRSLTSSSTITGNEPKFAAQASSHTVDCNRPEKLLFHLIRIINYEFGHISSRAYPCHRIWFEEPRRILDFLWLEIQDALALRIARHVHTWQQGSHSKPNSTDKFWTDQHDKLGAHLGKKTTHVQKQMSYFDL